MKREDILYLLKIAIFIALFIVAIRFFIYLLPFIIVGLIIMLAYDYYKKNNRDDNKKDKGVMDAKIIKEKKDDESK